MSCSTLVDDEVEGLLRCEVDEEDLNGVMERKESNERAAACGLDLDGHEERTDGESRASEAFKAPHHAKALFAITQSSENEKTSSSAEGEAHAFHCN